MTENYFVDVAEHGSMHTRMRDVSENEATEFVRDLVNEKIAEGYVVIDTHSGIVLMRNAQFKAYSIRIRRCVEAVAS